MKIKAESSRLQDLRAYLVEERLRLTAEIQSKDVCGQEQAGYGNHIADDATEVFEQTKHLALKRGLEVRLSQVEDALRKMEDGGYGLCEACGAAIDPARLRALPSAELCYACQVRSEEGKGNSWRKTK